MKRPRTRSQILDELDSDLGWRIKEIASLRRAIRDANGANQTALLRAAVPILYAHWEGYIKQAAIGYGGYVSGLGMKFSSVLPNFAGLKALAHVKTLHAITRKVFVSSTLLEKLYAIDLEDVDIPLERHIAKIGNLNYDLFGQIASFLALNVEAYQSKRVLIDEQLLKLRNDIAHGEHLLIDVDGFENLSNEILILIRQFKSDVQNAVALKSYLRGNLATAASVAI